ncbi:MULTISPECIES: type II secretion system protein [unclassified Campylobacter]|uniref:type II secretion system protein n=1 Tax=unclassified Campylobacter TaxID=2593542 RepID=UPI0022E9D82E|nr:MULTISPECIES: prepilin-type N-terminal cleavage/methylation domain-containing protein [unclassified Campylobacter]MDA3043977.1 prepilin-type N-terminal cleavage/methylation domain-containing protein [Campylobacter sp. JMF_09 ED2]MDA3045534.1 prepilin-type N-terminal cleavage/methylation domain-containing protein [Campylobacter sp. JMF_07 ED4]MDA3064661.1 prepilin-type N-terminal cleavage/methylation domain-containing protein [Campylobacter sp. JMF_11 EL3]MDA3072045.1 prepilin-type N-terminal
MRKGFTMIELIFVIVILGILAAVAIPRLAATRDDAEVAKAATNVSTILSDIGAYYTSQAEFAKSIKDMTNVAVDGEGKLALPEGAAEGAAQAGSVFLTSAGKKCLELTLTTAVDTVSNKAPAYMTVADGSDTTSSICKKVQADTAVTKLKDSTFVPKECETKSTDQKSCLAWKDAKAVKGIPLIGLSVVR